MRARACWVLALGVVSLWGCGGSGGGGSGGLGDEGCGDVGGGGPPMTFKLSGEAGLDGSVTSDGVVSVQGGGPVTGDVDAQEQGRVSRQFFSFSLGGIPPGATVTLATLSIQQRLVFGTPYVTHGDVLLEHFAHGTTLDSGDFAAAPLPGGSLVLSGDATIEVKTLDVTAFVANDVAACRPRTQFRLRFSGTESDADGLNDYCHFVDTESSGTLDGIPPLLEVTFTP